MPEKNRQGLVPGLVGGWLALALVSSSALAQQVTDFAYRATIDTDGEAIQLIDLSSEILTGLARADLADIAVFNSAGQRLPQRLGRQPDRWEKQQLDLDFHVFRQFAERSEKQVTRRERRQDGDGMSELTTTETIPVVGADNRYLVDLGADANERRFDRLELEWVQQPVDRLLELRVEVGDDLGGMRALDAPLVLGNSAAGEADWRSIAGIDLRHRYLSLAPRTGMDHFELLRVIGHYRTRVAAPPLTLARAPSIQQESGRFFYIVDLPWAVRPRALRLLPGQPSRMLVADMYLSGDQQPRRLARKQIRQHSFDNARIAGLPAVPLPRGDYDRLWFEFSETPQTPPQVEFHFEPRQLFFLADGRPPYTLAWGAYNQAAGADDLRGLLGENLADELRDASVASLGPAAEAGGLARLQPDRPLPWKQWMLWALLIAAALVTARMAFSLFREMNSGNPPPAD